MLCFSQRIMIIAMEGISKSELLDVLKNTSDPNSFDENEIFFILPRMLSNDYTHWWRNWATTDGTWKWTLYI